VEAGFRSSASPPPRSPLGVEAATDPGTERAERGRAAGGKFAFVSAVVLLLVFSNGWQVLLFGPEIHTPTSEPSVLLRSIYFPFYALALSFLLTTPMASLRAAVRAPLLWFIVGLTFISVFWSVDPDITDRRSIALFFTTLFGLGLAARFEWRSLSEVLATGFAILAVVSFLLGLLLPTWGRMTEIFPGAWSGVFNEKNALGNRMALGVLIFLAAAALNPQRRVLWSAMATLALLLIVLSTSKTSIISLGLGLSSFGLVFLVRRGPVTAVVATFVAGSSVVLLGLALLFSFDSILGLLGKDATLTGRTVLWAAITRQAELRPWTGYGYAAVWTEQTIWGPLAWITKQAGFTAHEAHNSWLELWLSLGYWGVGLFALYLIEIWIRAILALYRNPGAYLALPILTIFTVTTLDETVVLNYNDLVWVLFVALAVRLACPTTSTAARPLESAAQDSFGFGGAARSA
jgi:O-antigen ligase